MAGDNFVKHSPLSEEWQQWTTFREFSYFSRVKRVGTSADKLSKSTGAGPLVCLFNCLSRSLAQILHPDK